MERTAPIARRSAADVLDVPTGLPSETLDWSTAWQRLIPLWRHGVWFMAVFAVLAAAVSVRLDVQQLKKDMDRGTRAQRESTVLNDRLRLEVDARRRVAAMEAVAAGLEMGPEASVVRIGSVRQ
jgi:hypothetical protein